MLNIFFYFSFVLSTRTLSQYPINMKTYSKATTNNLFNANL